MQELMWYALSHGTTRPVSNHDMPLWFAALLVFGFVWASVLIGSGMTEWCRSRREKHLTEAARPR